VPVYPASIETPTGNADKEQDRQCGQSSAARDDAADEAGADRAGDWEPQCHRHEHHSR